MYGIDPLTEKYPSVSAYTYCMGNPVKLVDVDGCLPQIPIIVGILEIKGIAYLMENYATNHNLKTAGFVINHPIISYNVGEYKKGNKNISTYAGNFQINICLAAGLNTGSEGDYGNAIRHTLWQAILTREYGEEMAKRIGYMHEDGNIDVSKRVFSEMAEADKTIDLLNH